MVSEFCKLAEEKEPRLLAFHIYVSEDQSSEVVLQIHPDAESMQHHLEVMREKVRETFAYTDFESLEIYGQPNDELREWIERVSEGVPFTLPRGTLGWLHAARRNHCRVARPGEPLTARSTRPASSSRSLIRPRPPVSPENQGLPSRRAYDLTRSHVDERRSVPCGCGSRVLREETLLPRWRLFFLTIEQGGLRIGEAVGASLG